MKRQQVRLRVGGAPELRRIRKLDRPPRSLHPTSGFSDNPDLARVAEQASSGRLQVRFRYRRMASRTGRVVEETLHDRGTALVRRLILAPGETTRRHRDPFHRVWVVFRGDALGIEFRDGSARVPLKVTPGQVDWDEPSDCIHRAVNIADVPYHVGSVFLPAHPDDLPTDTRPQHAPS